MNDFKLVNCSSSVDLEYIRGVEDEFSIAFPPEYIELILNYNGGIPSEKKLILNNGSYVVERFLSFDPEYKTSIYGAYDIEVVWSQIEDRLPEDVIPIAVLFSGDMLCIDFRCANKSIVLWDHEESDSENFKITLVAKNFVEFTKLLTRLK